MATARPENAPPLPTTAASDIYLCEELKKSRVRKGKTEYLVKWKNFSDKHNTWEPVDNILDPVLIENFLAKEARKQMRKRGRGKKTATTRKRQIRNTRNNHEAASETTASDEASTSAAEVETIDATESTNNDSNMDVEPIKDEKVSAMNEDSVDASTNKNELAEPSVDKVVPQEPEGREEKNQSTLSSDATAQETKKSEETMEEEPSKSEELPRHEANEINGEQPVAEDTQLAETKVKPVVTAVVVEQSASTVVISDGTEEKLVVTEVQTVVKEVASGGISDYRY